MAPTCRRSLLFHFHPPLARDTPSLLCPASAISPLPPVPMPAAATAYPRSATRGGNRLPRLTPPIRARKHLELDSEKPWMAATSPRTEPVPSLPFSTFGPAPNPN